MSRTVHEHLIVQVLKEKIFQKKSVWGTGEITGSTRCFFHEIDSANKRRLPHLGG